jgi:uncharacterized protein (DUF2141 family)
MKKLTISFLTLALAAVAFAASAVTFQLGSTVTVAGTELKPGEYKITVEDGTVTFKSDRKTVKVPGTTTKGSEKYRFTTMESEGSNLKAIHVGNSDTVIVFPVAGATGGN